MNILLQNLLTPVRRNVMSMDYAFSLSDQWGFRADALFQNLGALISSKESLINILVDKMENLSSDDDISENEKSNDEAGISNEKSNEKNNKKEREKIEKIVKKEMEDVFWLSEMKDKIKTILSDRQKNYFTPDEVEFFAQIETKYYKMIMVPSMRKKIDNEYKRQAEISNGLNNLILEVDNKWDNAVPEAQIKLFVQNEIRRIFPELRENELETLADNFYATITHGKNVRVNLNEEQINKLKDHCTKKGVEGTCGICMEDFTPNDEATILPCGGHHSYHPHCIFPWLKMSVNCPMCKCDLREKIENISESSDV